MASQEILPADRIRELSSISEDAAAMLDAAGRAIHTLTNRPLIDDQDTEMGDDTDKSNSVESRKELFTANVKTYYNGLQAVTARLRRQAYALEEAGIIEPEPPAFSSTAQQQKQPQNGPSSGAPSVGADADRITNGGLGNLDVGYLNSRGNKVGAEKEAELVEDTKKLLEEMTSKQ